MGRARKVPLKEILLLPEIHARDLSVTRLKAERSALMNLLETSQKGIGIKAQRDVSATKQGEALGKLIPPLVVAKIPEDLPSHHKAEAKDKLYVLVDGYSRYSAIGETLGLDVRVPIEEKDARTMTDLMTLALELNGSHPLPLTKEQQQAHLFRLMLHGELHDLSLNELLLKFSGILSRTSLSEYRNLALWTREFLNLETASFDEIAPRLKEFANNAIGEFYTPKIDEKGYPTKGTLSLCKESIEHGLDKVIAKHEAKLERSLNDRTQVLKEVRSDLKGLDLRGQKAVLLRQLSEIEREIASTEDTQAPTVKDSHNALAEWVEDDGL